ncbi:MAG TPA: CoB--CoM heterodisulfide reductase iron-sulfur subunit A family protein [Deltaproteobacteria bacterium]|nr:CoB--CoM heterodisulfide reductase iron-sulfur subunit A family protein [Deltaproteobacteria bacterium]
MTKDSKVQLPVLVAGGGVAGISAALDLARAGKTVHLIERKASLGGQVASLDKLYPTDHCAFCPLWTEIRSCVLHKNIVLHTLTEIRTVEEIDGSLEVRLAQSPRYIDASRCILCGRCVPKCPVSAISSGPEHAYPQTYVIDPQACTRCGDCVDICPTAAIDITGELSQSTILAGEIIWATGFQDVDISPLEDYGYGTHPNILTSLEFEELTAESGVNKGAILTRNGAKPKRIAFIQCAGARDLRLFPYCSAVCCMHALKQAQWVKRRSPEIECTIFYTDLRAEGRHYYTYYLREIGSGAIELLRSRPGLIYTLPDGSGIAVTYEDTSTQKRLIRVYDMVVLNGALKPSLTSGQPDLAGLTDEEGLMKGSYSRMYPCGFCREPMDVEASVVQASAASLEVFLGGSSHGK